MILQVTIDNARNVFETVHAATWSSIRRLSNDRKMRNIEWSWHAILILKSVFFVIMTGLVCVIFKDNYVKTNEDICILSATKGLYFLAI